MKKILKRLATGFLAFATIVTALPTTAVHASEKQYWTESTERVGIIEKVMNDGSIGSTFNEGMMKVEGETAYCVDINTNFKNGYKTRADASTRMSADQISDVALSLEYVKQYAQSREGKIHALQIATESSIRSIQEQAKKLATGKLREVALQKIDEQTEAPVSMIGDNQVDYRFFIGFKLIVTEEKVSLDSMKKSALMTFQEFLHEVNHTLMNDFISMPDDEINRYMKMEKLLENKISRRFKFRRLDKNDFGYLIEHIYGRDGVAYEDYEYSLPKKKLKKETLIKQYDLIRPTRCLIEENQRYLRLEHEDSESFISYFTVNAIVGELDFPSSEIFYFQQQQFIFPVDTSMNVEIVGNRKALSTVLNKKKELKDLDNHAYQSGSETASNVVDALDSVDLIRDSRGYSYSLATAI